MRANPGFDWILLTDDHTPYDFPANLTVKYYTLSELAARFQSCFDFPISLSSIRKICDYRPAFGDIFREELNGYDYWGYCDMDEFFGDLAAYLTPDYLSRYDKLFCYGHMTILRNSEQMRTLYRHPVPANFPLRPDYLYRDYREVYAGAPDGCVYEENGMLLLCESAGVRSCYDHLFADVIPYRSRFRSVNWDPRDNSSRAESPRDFVVLWDEGRVFLIGEEGGALVRREVLYAHLQKRPLSMRRFDPACRRFLIYPNRVHSLREGEDTSAAVRAALRRTNARALLHIDEGRRSLQGKAFLWRHRFRKYILRRPD